MSCKKSCIAGIVVFFIGLAVGVGVTLTIYFLTKPDPEVATTTTPRPVTTVRFNIDNDVPGLAVYKLKDFKTSSRVTGMAITPGGNPRLATVQSAAPQLVSYSLEGARIGNGVTTGAPTTDYWDLVAHGNDLLVGNGYSYNGSLHVYNGDLAYQNKEIMLDHSPRGMFSKGDTLWVAAHFVEQKVYKYTLDAIHDIVKANTEVFVANGTVLINQPYDVVANSNRVGVACWSSRNVHMFNKEGKKLFTYKGTPVGQDSSLLYQPSAVVMDTKNRLYVGDYHNQRIAVLSDNGKLLGYLATKEAGLLRPQSMLLRASDLYVSHHDNKQSMISIFKLQWL